MTHDDLDKLYDRVLGRGLYSPQVLTSRLKRALVSAGFDVELDCSDDLRKLPTEAIPIAAAYLEGKPYQASPDVDRAANSAANTIRKTG